MGTDASSTCVGKVAAGDKAAINAEGKFPRTSLRDLKTAAAKPNPNAIVRRPRVQTAATSAGMDHGEHHQLSNGLSLGHVESTTRPWTADRSWFTAITSAFEYVARSHALSEASGAPMSNGA
jgi:hypothetical protein